MRMPTHIVIDTTDGWTWARDRNGNPFTDETAHAWAKLLNDERKPERRTFIVAVVTPEMSPEWIQAFHKPSDEVAVPGE